MPRYRCTVVVSTNEMQAIVNDLAARDARFADVVGRHPLCTLAQRTPTTSHFEALVESVISQQLSVKAADTIYGRLRTVVGGDVTPHAVRAVPDFAVREAGVSGAKLKTIRGISEAAASARIDVERLHEIDDDHVIAEQLTSLWGVGRWTVDMFMMGQLGRLDVWPVGDLGVRRGWERIHDLPERVTPTSLAEAGEHLRPYRSVVAWYCWREADA